jgi:hypothetical protein
MSRGALWLLIVFFPLGLVAQTVALPTKSGWVIHSHGSQNKVNESVLYIGVFDSHKLTTYCGYREMGILNHKGEILYRVQSKIETLDYGFFLVADSVLIQVSQGQLSEKLFTLVQNHELWMLGRSGNQMLAINKITGSQVLINTTRYQVVQDFLFLNEAEMSFLYSPEGKLLDTTRVFSSNPFEIESDYCSALRHVTGNIVIWFTPRMRLLLLDGQKVSIEKAQRVSVLNSHIEIVETGKVHLLDLKSKRITLSTNGEMLRPMGNDHILFTRNNKMGLLNGSGKQLIPAEYDNISLFKQYTLVKKGDFTGLFNQDFVQVLACNYTSIEPRYHFYYTRKFSGQGLVSRKTNKEILAPVYDQILIKDNRIKAWLGNQMRIFVINENHEIVDEFIVNNVVSADRANYVDAKIDFDPRLFQIGWFHESRETRNDVGGVVHRLIWGIKNERDSVILKPSVANIRYIHQAPLTLFPLPESDNKFYRYSFGGINHETGKIVPQLTILDIDTNDFHYRNFARFTSPNLQHGILHRDCKFSLFAYIDRGEAPLLRVCRSGVFTLVDDKLAEENCEPIINQNLNSIEPYFGRSIDTKFVSHLMFDKAKWNFLNADGLPIFEEDFEYAYPFVGSHAIVLTKTGFGVVDSNKFIIEPIYRSIKRVYFNGDTLFMVEQKPQGATLFQFSHGMLHNLQIHNVNVQKSRDLLTLLATANKRHIVHEELGLIQDSLSSVKLYDRGYFVERNKKQFFIFNHEGELLCETELRPKQILNDDLFVFQDKGLFALCDMQGSQISDLKYSSINMNGSFVLAQSRNGIDVYNELGNTLMSGVEKVFVDAVSGKLLYVLKGKMYIVDTTFQPLKKIKYVDVVLGFVDDKIYLRNGKILNLEGKELNHLFGKYDEFHYLGEDVISFSTKSGYHALYDLNWNPINVAKEKVKKPRVLSGDVLQFRSSGSVYLFNRSSGSSLSVAEVFGTFHDDLICVRLHDESYGYFNGALENPFNMTFQRAKPFRGGYAAVRFESGWGIINQDGAPELTPCLNEISVLSSDLVLSLSHSYLGLIDGRGVELVPIAYDAIILQKDYIRVHNYGKIEIWNRRFEKILESDVFGVGGSLFK